MNEKKIEAIQKNFAKFCEACHIKGAVLFLEREDFAAGITCLQIGHSPEKLLKISQAIIVMAKDVYKDVVINTMNDPFVIFAKPNFNPSNN